MTNCLTRRSAHAVAAAVFLAACAGGAAGAPPRGVKRQSPPPAASARKSTTVDGLAIRDYSKLSVSTLHVSDLRFIGPGVRVSPRDPTNPTQFLVTAASITIRQPRVRGKAVVEGDMAGPISFWIVRKEGGVVSRVRGTAARALYSEAAGTLTLSDVDAALEDSKSLYAPGAVHGAALAISLQQGKAAPTGYRLYGSGPGNVIRLPIKPASTPAAAGPTAGFRGPVEAAGFSSATLVPNRLARIRGAGTTLTFQNLADGSSGVIHAPQIMAALNGGLRAASATGGVAFHVTRKPPGAASAVDLDGRSGAASYDANDSTLELTGGVAAMLTDPAALAAPARIRADRVHAVLSAPASYTAVGSPDEDSIEFQPQPARAPSKPAPPAKAAGSGAQSAAAAFARGPVTVTGFSTAMLRPGKSAQFSGPQVKVATSDPDTRAQGFLLGPAISVRITPGGALQSAAASGGVRYEWKRPLPGRSFTQVLEGTASDARFDVSGQQQIIHARGPLRISLTSPDQPEPALLTGTEQDSLVLNLTANTLDIASPDRGSTVQVTEPPARAPNKPAPPKRTRH